MVEPSRTSTQESLTTTVVHTLRTSPLPSAASLLNGFVGSVVKGSEAASHVRFSKSRSFMFGCADRANLVYPIHPRHIPPYAALEQPV